jgi:hypothetical protein
MEEVMKTAKPFGTPRRILHLLILAAGVLLAGLAFPIRAQEVPAAANPNPPTRPVRLIFIHHSTGQNWLADGNGGLGNRLKQNNYFVSDTNYGWGPFDQDVGSGQIGDHTDIGHWYNWFAPSAPHHLTYLGRLYDENQKHSSYSRRATVPPGENTVIMFKSCFPNSNLFGHPSDPPTTGSNPLRGRGADSPFMTVANAKGIYQDILNYFKTRPDKLFIVITAPPLARGDTAPGFTANARAFNNWLVKSWLKGYPLKNVAVFDFYNVLTSNGGNADTNDFRKRLGNHHRWWNGAVQHQRTVKNNVSAYPSSGVDSHPSAAGNLKATGEFVRLLNVYYHRWQESRNASPERDAVDFEGH